VYFKEEQRTSRGLKRDNTTVAGSFFTRSLTLSLLCSYCTRTRGPTRGADAAVDAAEDHRPQRSTATWRRIPAASRRWRVTVTARPGGQVGGGSRGLLAVSWRWAARRRRVSARAGGSRLAGGCQQGHALLPSTGGGRIGGRAVSEQRIRAAGTIDPDGEAAQRSSR
jgi:hypothetical protein